MRPGELLKKLKNGIGDLGLGVFGLVAMNAVLSLVVNPFIEHSFGAAFHGRILFYTSLAALMASAFGSGANYGRLKIYSDERETKNGEYNVFLLIVMAVLAGVTVLAIFLKKGDTAGSSFIGLFFLIVLTVLRYYGDVQYRMDLNYRRYALYYVAIAVGYLAGMLLFRLTNSWVLIMITGEVFGLLFVGISGTIFKKPVFALTKDFGRHFRILAVLSVSFLLSDFVASADRLLLPLFLDNGDELTAIFYYASLVGKMMSLLSTPLNGVLSGYLYNREGGITSRQFLKVVLLMLGIFVLVTAVSVGGSHLFVCLFYRDHYPEARPLFLLANAGQVIFFICNTMMVVVLRYTNEKIQMLISAAYIAVFLLVTIPLILHYGIYGMGWGILIVNLVKFILYAVLGLIGIRRKRKTEEAA